MRLVSDNTSADGGNDFTTPVISVNPISLAARDRGQDLEVRITAPTTGDNVPVVVLSHGMALTMDDYAPLVGFWAARGFAVVQPTHLDALGLAPDDPRTPLIWRIRADDLTAVLDQLDTIEAAVPGLAGRVDHDRIAVAGHSWGAQTASILAGARVVGADGTPGESMADPRVGAAVLMSLPGTGGADLSPLATEHFPFMSPDFSELKTPSLMVAGDRDQSPLTVRGPDWFTDGYRLSPGATDLLTLFGAEHGLGGIQGANDTRTTDESPERVALVRQITLAYLRTALGLDHDAWPTARRTLAAADAPLGIIDSK
ncbi:Alpha/beta hydrolase family protein [Streptomyces misionensis]|uniref:Alpha/beta hydrolase family protein n=1 Tax=Streptomyces misionensis TaxID=67331 RepID=A0A1H5HGW9_9ACTN|nr:alpha/beta fold hydrolase [Streptomyces misionensis]SEE26518.1 Alpha/beta hydrolase family protein [Streptomyces misionensis]